MTNPIYFTAARNYLKHDSTSGSDTMSGPVTSAYAGTIYTRNYTVTHNLGYAPICKVYYEPFNDDQIWPPTATRLALKVFNFFGDFSTGPGLIFWPTTTTLVIQLFYDTNALASNTYPIYWTIFKDFHLE